jgi:hypothetical protein
MNLLEKLKQFFMKKPAQNVAQEQTHPLDGSVRVHEEKMEKRSESLTTSAQVVNSEQKNEKLMTSETVTSPQTQNTPSEPITKPKKKPRRNYNTNQNQKKQDFNKTQTNKKPKNTKPKPNKQENT